MSMQMGWRWYGEGNDPITLSDIKQIPGVTSIVWALHHKMPGEDLGRERDQGSYRSDPRLRLQRRLRESVNVHDDIKIGLPTRDQ